MGKIYNSTLNRSKKPIKRSAIKRGKTKLRKIRLKPIKSLKGRAWRAIARYSRLRDRNCITCRLGAAENAGHYIHNTDKENNTLGGNALWYDERNINGQCVRCNKWMNGMPRPYAIVLEERHGHGILQELRDLYNTKKKWTREEVTAVAEKYEALLATLEKENPPIL